jgi:hypothetical protein
MITEYSDIFRRDKLEDKFQEQDSQLGQVTVTLTAAQVIAMFTTPVQIVPSAGAGKVVQFVDAVNYLDAGATPFSGGGTVRFQNGTGTILSSTAAATTITSATDVVATIPSSSTTSLLAANEGIFISNASGVFAAGDGTLKVTVNYRVITI